MKKFRLSDTFQNPVLMAAAIVVFTIVLQLLFFLLKPLIPDLIDERSAYVVTVAMLLFYILFNAISTFGSDDLAKNWSQSIMGIALLGAVGFGISYLVSGKSINELAGFRDIVLIVLIGFFALKIIATSIKGIVLYTKRLDSERK